LDEKPLDHWAAGAGLDWVLDNDAKALPFLLDAHLQQSSLSTADLHADPDKNLLAKISPGIFRPDGNLNPREIPIALQLPDWTQWLPRIHPRDAWGTAFTHSEFAVMYEGKQGRNERVRHDLSLRSQLAGTRTPEANIRSATNAFNRWSQARRAFLGRYVNARTTWSAELTDKVYSTQLWQLMKTWELTQDFQLEGTGRRLLAEGAEPRIWCNTIPQETAPDTMHIANGPAGVGGSALIPAS
jgi:hypothetical protein